ncbi:MAG: hypothetical protein RR919_09045 [Bacteroidales bacterium]
MERKHLIEILQDPKIAVQLRRCKDPKEAYELLKDKTNLSFDAFKKEMTDLKDAYSDKEAALLQEEDVKAALNCCDNDSTVTTVTTVTTITASASAADF